nr:hypothetical protein [Tanacetum cinerariifolium]
GKTLRFGSCVLSLAIWFCVLVLRFDKRHAAFLLVTRCVLLQDTLRFAVRLVAFCFKTRCVLLQDILRFASDLVAFCFKACCVLPQDTLHFASRHLAFCLMVALHFVYFLRPYLRFVDEGKPAGSTALGASTAIGSRETTRGGGLKYSLNNGENMISLYFLDCGT